jgi:heparan-alpha-glucosaminide N-acetyltransferase
MEDDTTERIFCKANQPARFFYLSSFKLLQMVGSSQRIASIDILRALTMVLMIFVNDLWSLKNIPAWLGHVESGVDGIGLADTVFPAFLFIVGMSIPFAMENRRLKGDKKKDLVQHVLVRKVALLVMGVFLVNGESINESATGMHRLVWNVICCTCFITIWNAYPKTANRSLVLAAKGSAILILIILAVIYKGGEGASSFSPKWWGILGLIGWSYLVSGLVAVYAKDNIKVIAGAWVFLAGLSMLWHAKLVPPFLHFIPHPIIGGTEAGLTMGGVLTSMIFRYYRARNDNRTLSVVLLSFAGALIILSMITRPFWGLAKLGATPAWLFLCSAFTIVVFVWIYWLVDVYVKANWFSIIKPAGTDTLMTYLIPYYAYAATWFLGIRIPEFMLQGSIGLFKSFLFALFCVWVTWLLAKRGVRLKL